MAAASDKLTVADLCNLFLERQESRAKAGKITQRHFSDCLQSCHRLVNHIGKFFRVSAMRAADFKAYRTSFPDTCGPSMISGEIQRLRSAFKWAFESDLIPTIPNFGPDFGKLSKTVARRDQQQRQAKRGGKLDYTAEEIQKLLQASSGWLKACILLGSMDGSGMLIVGDYRRRF